MLLAGAGCACAADADHIHTNIGEIQKDIPNDSSLQYFEPDWFDIDTKPSPFDPFQPSQFDPVQPSPFEPDNPLA